VSSRADLAVVVGAGGVGGYCVQVARAFGAQVVAIDVDARKLQAAVADGGAALALNAREHDAKALKKAVADFAAAPGLRSTEWKIFECSGTAAGQTSAFGLLVHGATLSVVGFTMDKVEVRLSNLMAFDARASATGAARPSSTRPRWTSCSTARCAGALRRDASAGPHQHRLRCRACARDHAPRGDGALNASPPPTLVPRGEP
jgi:threonine dehydrogenase-like Zn-dependent dehydrogenase